jgi:dolichol-phosphate mannosyltransferase
MPQVDPKRKTLVLVPTFNEINNVGTILQQLLELKVDLDVLFIDDNSPDGTGQLLEKISRNLPKVFIKHRSGKLGIGSAHREGIIWAYNNNYEKLITLDCDATHPPEYIPAFVDKSSQFDLVVGTRHLNKSSLADWSLRRKILTKVGHLLTYFCLGIPYDATSAYRIYNLATISPKFLELTRSNSYSFFFETIFILNCNRYKISEISIHLPSRTKDQSKMRYLDILSSLILLFILLFEKKICPKKFITKN